MKTPNRQSEARGNSTPKIVIVAAHDSLGGAARAIYRVFSALRQNFSEEAEFSLRVIHKTRDDADIIGGKPTRNRLEFLEYFIRTRFRKYFPRKPFESENTLLHSQALYPTGLGRELNSCGADLLLLGWLGNGTMSIREIGKLKPPTVFRLSDMWVFSGSEHYTDTGRYKVGYASRTRPDHETGPDIDRETFNRKRRNWRKPRHLISLSSWLTSEARTSALTENWPVSTIPVPIDVEFWKPLPKANSRKKLNLPKDDLLILFGAGGGTSQPHKGADLLFSALENLPASVDDGTGPKQIRGVIFGQDDGPQLIGEIPVTYLGRLDDDGLRLAYSSTDVMIVPSRLEAFGQVAAEAQCCGTPVIAFDNSGLTDVVADQETGRLVPAFDTVGLERAIQWVLEDSERREGLGKAARARAVALWNPEVVASQYMKVFREILTPKV